MRRLMAILLAAALLLSACALGEGMRVTAKHINLADDSENSLYLAGYEVVLEYAEQGETAGVRARVLMDGAELYRMDRVLLGDVLLMEVDAANLQENYALDLVEAYDSMTQVDRMNTLPVWEVLAGDSAPLTEMFEQLAATVAEGVTDVGVTQRNGLDYQTMQIEITDEQAHAFGRELVGQLLTMSGYFADLDNIVFGSGMEISVSGELCQGEENDLLDLKITLRSEESEEEIKFILDAEHTQAEGVDLYQIFLMAVVDKQHYGISMDVELEPSDADWLPEDAGGTRDLTTLSPEEMQEMGYESDAEMIREFAMSALAVQYAGELVEMLRAG